MLKVETPIATYCVAAGRAHYDDKNSISTEAKIFAKQKKWVENGLKQELTSFYIVTYRNLYVSYVIECERRSHLKGNATLKKARNWMCCYLGNIEGLKAMTKMHANH